MRTLSSLAAVVALTSASIVSAAPLFSVTDLGGLGVSLASRGSSVGSTAMVGGTSYSNSTTPNAMTATIGGGGSVTLVSYPAQPTTLISFGMGIGGVDGETLVGYRQVASRGSYQAFTGNGGVITDLHATITGGGSPFAGGDTSRGMAISANGTVVGQAKAGSALQAFTLAGSTVTAIPMIGGYSNSLATAINGHDLAVGFDYNGTWNYSIGSAISGGVSHAKAFSFDGVTMTSLNTLGGLDSIATAVNSAGAIVGQSTLLGTDALDTKGHAFVYNGGVMTQLAEAAGATMSLADDINDSGDIVGTYRTAAFANHAFLYRNGAMVDLNTLISGAGWVLTEATSINEDGYITGYGTHNGVQSAFLLAPVAGAAVPEPASVGLLGIGAVALVARRRRA